MTGIPTQSSWYTLPKYRVEIMTDVYYLALRQPNVWWRWWQWVLLGWKWSRSP